MKWLREINGRTGLISMLAVVFLATGSLAGVHPVVQNCGAACCQPSNSHGVGTAGAKLSSVQPKSCCAGMAGSHCDLQGQPVAQRSNFIQAVPSSPHGSQVGVPVSHTRWLTSGVSAIERPPASKAAPDAIAIYIQIQSILI